jgi:hypothetical protein
VQGAGPQLQVIPQRTPEAAAAKDRAPNTASADWAACSKTRVR